MLCIGKLDKCISCPSYYYFNIYYASLNCIKKWCLKWYSVEVRFRKVVNEYLPSNVFYIASFFFCVWLYNLHVIMISMYFVTIKFDANSFIIVTYEHPLHNRCIFSIKTRTRNFSNMFLTYFLSKPWNVFKQLVFDFIVMKASKRHDKL